MNGYEVLSDDLGPSNLPDSAVGAEQIGHGEGERDDGGSAALLKEKGPDHGILLPHRKPRVLETSSMSIRKYVAAAMAVIGVSVASACGAGSASPGKASESDIESVASSALEKESGVKPDKVDCPKGMTVKAGEKMRCTLTHEGDSTGMTVTVDSVDGSKYHVSVEVDPKGATVAKEDLEKSIGDRLESQTGERPASVECPGDIAVAKDVTVECVLTAVGGEKYGATVKVTAAEGTRISYDIQVASEPME